MSHKLVKTKSLLYGAICKLDKELLALLEGKSRELLTLLPPEKVVKLYSPARREFLKALAHEQSAIPYHPSPTLERKLWGISFRSPLMNGAGMFKEGFGYHFVFSQGAGAYLAGTATAIPRLGFPYDTFTERGLHSFAPLHPFVPLPKSQAALNKLGLPNPGDALMQQRLQEIEKVSGCPLGISVALSPNFLKAHGEENALKTLVRGMHGYLASGVDFIELNESCPNMGEKFAESSLFSHLSFIKNSFLNERKRHLPVIVKLSCDIQYQQISGVMDLLFHLGYDGVNFGNTSIDYAEVRKQIHPKEQKLFDYFTSTYGGGVSGKPLQQKSLQIASAAVRYLRQGPPTQEFHVIRAGGISSVEDLVASEAAGISLNQWFTGYFERFAEHGHEVYRKMFREYGLAKKR